MLPTASDVPLNVGSQQNYLPKMTNEEYQKRLSQTFTCTDDPYTDKSPTTPHWSAKHISIPRPVTKEQRATEKRIESKLHRQFTPSDIAPTPYVKDLRLPPTVVQVDELSLAYTNAHPRDKNVCMLLDPKTKFRGYAIREPSGRMNFANIITSSSFAPIWAPFDVSKWHNSILKNPSKYKRKEFRQCKTVEDIVAVNKRVSLDPGTKIHETIEYLENDSLDMEALDDPDTIECLQQYIRDIRGSPELKDCTPYRTEWVIYDEELRLAGTIDLVLRAPDGTFIIVDHKRVPPNKFDVFCYGQFDGCCQGLGKNIVNKYSLQLHFYKYILERHYGMKISAMYLGRMYPCPPRARKKDKYVGQLYRVTDTNQIYFLRMCQERASSMKAHIKQCEQMHPVADNIYKWERRYGEPMWYKPELPEVAKFEMLVDEFCVYDEEDEKKHLEVPSQPVGRTFEFNEVPVSVYTGGAFNLDVAMAEEYGLPAPPVVPVVPTQQPSTDILSTTETFEFVPF